MQISNTSSGVKLCDIRLVIIHIDGTNFTNNTKFPTPLAVSNYVNNTLTLNYDVDDFGTYHNRLVRASNVIHYFNKNRHTDSAVFTDNTKFPTPLAVSNYVRQNYVNVDSRFTTYVPIAGTDVFNGNQNIPTANAIYGYINWIFSEDTKVENTVVNKLNAKTFNLQQYADNGVSSFTNDTKLTTPAAVSNYLNYKFNTQYTHTDGNDFTDNTKFPTRVVSTCVTNQFDALRINSSGMDKFNDNKFVTAKAIMDDLSNNFIPGYALADSGFEGTSFYDDEIPTTAEASNIANAILNMNIGDLRRW